MSRQYSEPTGQRPTNDGVVIGIPAYNEAETVAEVVEAGLEAAPTVVVVDDGSDDETATRAAQAGATVVQHGDNRGYGAALESIFQTAHDLDADHLVVVDADGQHDPTDATDLVELQQSTDAEIVIGSRFVGDSPSDAPLYRRFGLAVINLLVGLGLRVGYSTPRIHDSQSGFRAYDERAIEMLAERADLSDGMDASVDILFHAASERCSFVETPIDISYDVAEANTHNPVVHGAVLVQNVLARVVADQPIRLLGIPGATCLLFGLLLGEDLVTDVPLLATVPALLISILIVTGSSLAGMALVIQAIPSEQ